MSIHPLVVFLVLAMCGCAFAALHMPISQLSGHVWRTLFSALTVSYLGVLSYFWLLGLRTNSGDVPHVYWAILVYVVGSGIVIAIRQRRLRT
ncbi:MAG: hypothetical protein Q7U89_06015 [Coriobacteriia bacterium]|nr:hypothetical protein [Coriobacteriia bacterium]